MTSKRMLANAFGQIRFYIKIEPELLQRKSYFSILCSFLHFINTIYIISRNDFYCLFPQVSMTCKTKAWLECKLCKYKTLRRFQTLMMPFIALCFYYQSNKKSIIEIDINNITHIVKRCSTLILHKRQNCLQYK